jgi:hypothetical protein
MSNRRQRYLKLEMAELTGDTRPVLVLRSRAERTAIGSPMLIKLRSGRRIIVRQVAGTVLRSPTWRGNGLKDPRQTIAEEFCPINDGGDAGRHQRLAAIRQIFGLWKNRSDTPSDGLEYQDEMRAEW